RHCRRRGMASFPGADSSRAADRRLRADRAGRLRVEAAPCGQVRADLAVCARQRDRGTARRRIVTMAPAVQMRMAVGGLLITFALYNWFRPQSTVAAEAGAMADGTVGVVNGVVGGATGLAGLATVVWCNLRGWPPAEQRAVFQPVGVATFVMIALWLGGSGRIGGGTAVRFLFGSCGA